MSNLQLSLGKNDEAVITFGACKLGNYLTAGRSLKVDVVLHDGPNLREIQKTLFKAKAQNFNGLVTIKLNDKDYILDGSIWMDLADAMFGYVMHKDLSGLVEDIS